MKPPAPGSSLKHTIYALIVNFMLYLSLHCENKENKTKRDRVWSIKKIEFVWFIAE